MQDFETTANDAESGADQDGKAPARERLSKTATYIVRRVILLLSFGPGLLGFLWLLGRILKR
jgi:hypothetical protein